MFARKLPPRRAAVALFGLVTTVLALAAAPPPALAHDVEGLDLHAIVEHVGQRIPATAEGAGESAAHKAYVKLGKLLAKESHHGLADDLAKLAAVAKAVSKALAADATLRNLLDAALQEASHALEHEPGSIESLIGQISSQKSQLKIEKATLKARDAHVASEELEDKAKALKGFAKAAKGFAKAEASAEKLIDKQGGPAAQNLPAVPGNIYTVAGTGIGGRNGDGVEARRTNLYWVEEIKLGPDGLLYILDWNNHILRRREADGTIKTIAGTGVPGDTEGPALDMAFNHPSALAFDDKGRVFIAAWHNHKVKVYDPTGETPVVYTIAGGPAGNSGDGGPATDARFNLVPGVLLLPEGHPFGGGDLLATDATNQCVRIIRLATDPMTDDNIAGVTVQTGKVERIFGTNGAEGWEGDGGPAANAKLAFSRAQNAESDGRMAIDNAGNVYVVSGKAHVIRKISPDGMISTVAGSGVAGFSGDGGPATEAKLNFPADIEVAPDGTLFISDQFNHVVRKVSPDGTIATIAGVPGQIGYSGDEGPATAALLHRPSGLELDASGNLYVCDKNNSVLRVIASAAPGALLLPKAPYRLPALVRGAPPAKGASGTIDTFAGVGLPAYDGDGKLALDTAFYWPQDIAVNPSTGLLYIVDWNNHMIRRVEADGRVVRVAGVGQLGDTNGPALDVRLNHPTDIAFHPISGELYIATWHIDKIKRLNSSDNTIVAVSKPDGRRFFSGDGGDFSLAELNLPSSVKFDAAGNMFIGDEGNRRVRYVSAATNIIETIVGVGTAGFSGDGGDGREAELNLPVGQSAQPGGRVCLDPTGAYLYIADTDNHRIRRVVVATNIITTVAGNGTAAYSGDGGPATSAALFSPVDVDCDAQGNLYICERDGHTVRKVTWSDEAAGIGAIATVAGTGAKGYSGDKGAATSAALSLPSGIFVDRSNGRLYIADTYNSVVRVVWE
jgi:sugar lactone lactonase YvrE